MKRGDVVQLRSGGPKMTISNVNDVEGDRLAVVAWFDKDEKRNVEWFLEECLELCSEAPVYANGVAEDSVAYDPVLDNNVDELEVGVRSANVIRHSLNVTKIGDLVLFTKDDLIRKPNCGRRSVEEISEALSKLGLHLGMDPSGWPNQRQGYPGIATIVSRVSEDA